MPRCTAASLSGQTWTFAAPSRSQADVAHTVIYDLGADTLRCDCLAGTHGQPCKHAGAAIESVMRFHDEVRRAERRERERVG